MSIAARVDKFGPWIAIVLLVVVLAQGVRSTSEVADNTGWVDHTHQVIESVDDLTVNVLRSVVARRGYALSGDASESERSTRAMREVADAVARLRSLTIDNPGQQRRIDALEPLVGAYVARWDEAYAYRREHGFDPAHEVVEARLGAEAFRVLAERAAEMLDEERALLAIRAKRAEDSLAQTRGMELAGACLALLLIAVVFIRLRREVRRRERSEASVRASEQAVAGLNLDLARRIEARTAQLQLANDELESFSYALIHDLRAPLRGMASFADLLLEEHTQGLASDGRECVSEIQANARRMALLIDALDAMSRISRGEITRTTVDVTALAHGVPAAAAHPSTLLVVQEGMRVEADPRLVRTLLEVLIENAHKFSRGGAAPRVEAGRTELAGEAVLFVKDNGAGFDMAHYRKLFTPFGRLHTVDEFPGVGIGLAMAHRIVRSHGGRIWAEAQVGLGATFYFTLSAQPKEEGA